MKRIDCDQRSPEWLEARMGIPTASEFGNLVTPLWKLRDGDMVNTYLHTKLAEKWLGSPLQTFSGGMMEQGSLKEDEAIPWYEFKFDTLVTGVGFVTTDDGAAGCSPDGFLSGEMGLEIKCPSPHTHVKYLLDGCLPKEYATQVQGSMLVTGFKKWKFLSYCRGMPPLVLTVDRNETAIAALRSAISAFTEKFNAAYAQLLVTNGGPPKRSYTTSMDGEAVVQTANGISQDAIDDFLKG